MARGAKKTSLHERSEFLTLCKLWVLILLIILLSKQAPSCQPPYSSCTRHVTQGHIIERCPQRRKTRRAQWLRDPHSFEPGVPRLASF